MKIEVLKIKAKWFWRIVGRNGKILAHSEQYSQRNKAVKTAQRVFDGEFSGIKVIE